MKSQRVILLGLATMLAAIVALQRLRVAPELASATPANSEEPLSEGAVRRLGTLRYRHTLQDRNAVAIMTLSPDDKYLTSLGFEGLQVLNLETGEANSWLKPQHNAVAACFSPDGKALSTAEVEKTRDFRQPLQVRFHLRRYEVGTGKLLAEAIVGLKEHRVEWVRFSADGKFFLTCARGRAGVSTVWDA